MGVTPLAPQASASASSATFACRHFPVKFRGSGSGKVGGATRMSSVACAGPPGPIRPAVLVGIFVQTAVERVDDFTHLERLAHPRRDLHGHVVGHRARDATDED